MATELVDLQSDATLAPFFDESFSPQAFISQALTQSSSVLERLEGALTKVEHVLRAKVIAHHPELVRRASHVDEVEQQLRAVALRIRGLHAAVTKLKSDLIPPFTALQMHTMRLSNTQATCETLRTILRVVQLHEKLKTQMAKETGGRELTKAAQTLCDLDTLLRESSSACVPLATDADADAGADAADSDSGAVTALERYDASLGLDGIALVDARRVQIAAAGAALRDEAERMLWRALEAANATAPATANATANAQTTTTVATASVGIERPAAVQSAAQAAADLGTALQVYCNLGELHLIVDATLQRIERGVSSALKRALDMSTLDSAKPTTSTATSSASSASSVRTQLWSRIDAAMDTLLQHAMQVWHMQRVLVKKRDPVSTLPLMESMWVSRVRDMDAATAASAKQTLTAQRYSVESPVSLLGEHWALTVRAIERELDAATRSSSFLRNALVAEFPRLLGVVEQLYARVRSSTSTGGGSGSNGVLSPALVSIGAGAGTGAGSSSGALLTASLAAASTGLCHPRDRLALIGVLASHQNAYLTKAVSRLHEPIQLMFGASSSASGAGAGAGGSSTGGSAAKTHGSRLAPPSPSDLDGFIGVVHAELDAVRDSPALVAATLRSIGQALQLFVNRCEAVGDYASADAFAFRPAVAAAGSSAAAAAAAHAVSPAQLRNIAVFQLLVGAERAAAHLIATPHRWPSVPDAQRAVADALASARAQLAEVSAQLVAPMFAAFSAFADHLVAAMRAELASASSASASASTGSVPPAVSKYVKDALHALAALVADRCALYAGIAGSDHALDFRPTALHSAAASAAATDLLEPHVVECCQRLLGAFVRHASVLSSSSSSSSSSLATAASRDRLEVDARALVAGVERLVGAQATRPDVYAEIVGYLESMPPARAAATTAHAAISDANQTSADVSVAPTSL